VSKPVILSSLLSKGAGVGELKVGCEEWNFVDRFICFILEEADWAGLALRRAGSRPSPKESVPIVALRAVQAGRTDEGSLKVV